MAFLFDLLPVELLHPIFRYLWAHEILHGFSNQSDYLDGVLRGYDRYAICLCSMLKTQFDQICYQIQPKQVIALAIMDEDETPDQSTIFFSHFDIGQFINLQSFAILSSRESLLRKLDLLCQFNKFKSIVVPHISEFYWCFCGSNVDTVLPELKRLNIHEYRLKKLSKNLQHLSIPHCFCYKLGYLLPLVPNLRSLNITISLDIFPFWSKKIPSMDYLRQFILRVHYGRLTMGQIHEILTKMPRLIHFELELEDPIDVIGGDKWKSSVQHLNLDIEQATDIIDGNQWKYSVTHLQTFDFRFYLSKTPIKEVLDSFRTSFWLEQKRWFVAFDDCQSSPCLFTVPHFTPKSAIYSLNYRSIPCTSSEFCLDRFVNTLTLPVLRPLTHDFTNVTSLVLEMNDNLDRNKLLPYLQLPHLHSLSFDHLSLLDLLSSELVVKSIRILNVKTSVSQSNSEQICIIFPQVERLQIMIGDHHTMLSLINGLKYLSISKFIFGHSSSTAELTREWFQEHSSRLKLNNHFTYRINGNQVQLWMSVA